MHTSSVDSLQWVAVCAIDDLVPGLGTTALVGGQQIAVFRILNNDIYALNNLDPISQAYVLSRGVLGDENGELFVASPLYKNRFSLKTGECLDVQGQGVQTYQTQVSNGMLQIAIMEEDG